MLGPFGHLGSRVSDLVDDRLTPEERQRALQHVTGCAACAALVTQHQRQRRLTSELTSPAVPHDLEIKLLAFEGGPAPASGPWRDSRRRIPRLSVASVAVAAVGVVAVAGLYTAGAPQARTPESMAQVRAAGHEHVDWDATVANSTWPTSTQVLDLDALEQNLVRVDLTVDGVKLVVWEGPGLLEITDADAAATATVGDGTAYYVDGVWLMQVGRDVVAVSGPRAQTMKLLAEYDVPETTPVQRVIDGWNALLGGQA